MNDIKLSNKKLIQQMTLEEKAWQMVSVNNEVKDSIKISDDGKGIDPEKIVAKAIEKDPVSRALSTQRDR